MRAIRPEGGPDVATSDPDPKGNFSFRGAGGDAPAGGSPTASSPAPDEGETGYEIGITHRQEPQGSPAWAAYTSVPGLRRIPPKSGRVRDNYLVEQTVSSIISGAFKIYFRHFGTLFPIYILPAVPLAMIQTEAQLSGNRAFLILSVLMSLTVIYFIYGATTVAVSDVCLGNTPSFKRSYAKVLGKLVLMLLVTNILQMLAVVGGMVLLVIPGLVLLIWLMMSPSIVVLERKSGIAALERSKQLGDGSHWRNAGFFLLLIIILSGISLLIEALIGAVMAGVAFTFPHLLNDSISHVVAAVISGIQEGFAGPVVLISLVLLYYDMRVRKEGYDARALAEDLAR
jgi:hypothetical protein